MIEIYWSTRNWDSLMKEKQLPTLYDQYVNMVNPNITDHDDRFRKGIMSMIKEWMILP